MSQVALSFSTPGYESVYDLIYRLVPRSGGVYPGTLWGWFWREYLSDSFATHPAALQFLNAKKRPVPALFSEYLWQLCSAEVLTYRTGKVYRVRCSGGRV